MKLMTAIVCLILGACAQTSEMDSLAADMHAQWRYEEVVRSCKEQGLPVYIQRTGSRIRKELTRHEMMTAACARIN